MLTYEITRADTVLYSYVDSGHFEFMVTQDEQHDEDGYYVIDGKGYWLCQDDADEKDTDESKKSSEIEYDALEVYNGLEPSVFIAKFYDDDGNVADVEPTWEINCDFKDKLKISYAEKAIYISSNSSKLINKTFELVLSAEGYEPISVTIVIRAFI